MNVARGSVEWLTSTAGGGTYSTGNLGIGTLKGVMFWWVGIASGGADAVTDTVDQRCGVGFATSTSARRSIASYDDDAALTSDCGTVAANDCIAGTLNNAASRDAELDITTMDTGLVLTVDDQLATSNITIHFIAWSGDDITVAAVGDFSEPAAAGDVSPSVPGFTSDGADQVVIVASCQSSSAINTALAENAGISIGFATGTTDAENVCVGTSVDHASGATDTDGIGGTGKVLAQALRAGGTSWIIGKVSAWGTDQFTVTYSNPSGTGVYVAGRKSIFLAMKGGKWAAGSYAINGNSASATAAVSGLPFAPAGVAVIGRMNAAQNAGTGNGNARLSIGVGFSPSARQCAGTLNETATASSAVEVDKTVQFDQVLAYPSATGTLQSAYDINAMNSDGFEIIVDTAGGVASEWQGYLAFGEEAVQVPPGLLVTAPHRPAAWNRP